MLRKIGFDAHRGEIVAILKDHSKTKAKVGDHPPLPVYRISWDFTDEDIEAMGKWLVERFKFIEKCEELPDDELPMCSEEERWHKPDKWAVMKKGRKSALKLFDSAEDAQERLDSLPSGHYIEFRPGVDSKCSEYCSAAPFCSHYREMNGGE